MTNFPNDPFNQGGNYSGGTMYVQPGDTGAMASPPRTSILAIFALIVAILGFLICWLPIGGLIIGAFTVFLSIGAFVAISSSNGRKKGKGLAITGFSLGLVNVVLGIGCVIGMGMGGKMIQNYSKTLEAAQTGDVDTFNTYTTSNAQVTKDELAAFVSSYQPAMGNLKDAPPSFMQVFKGAFGAPAAMEEITSLQQAHRGQPLQLLPVLWNFDKGEGIVILVMDPASKGQTAAMGQIEDMVIIDKSSNTVVTRLSDVLSAAPSTPAP